MHMASHTQCIKTMSYYSCCDRMFSETYRGILHTCGILYTYMYLRLVVLCVHVPPVGSIVCTCTSGWWYCVYMYLRLVVLCVYTCTSSHRRTSMSPSTSCGRVRQNQGIPGCAQQLLPVPQPSPSHRGSLI